MPNYLKTRFGDQLAFLRGKREMTQDELAGHLGISRKALQNIELGKSAPKFSTIELICSKLNVEAEMFFSSTPSEPSNNPRVSELVLKLDKLPKTDLELMLQIADRFQAKPKSQLRPPPTNN
ncbi:helix-turn-helix transcriptional regulator [Asticcacaulis sp.]|uniref:helix-turn-helix domain-containing protein n=1 Tax=Asticcacaulis sp. TaxID=1872648 RepID=UPI002C80872E|nr:helix-turn-helix transcriptional regulator [Asticcacaulis sp.]HTM81561.1 helix-turn-helix transcriptional regulator [Asticcacaulis sp.]